MDKSNFFSILRTLTDAMKCPKCGENYDINEIQFVQQLEGFCLLQLSCKKCNLPMWVNFFASNNKPDFRLRYETGSELEFNFEPISADEVISFHKKIDNFDGNFKKAFGK